VHLCKELLRRSQTELLKLIRYVYSGISCWRLKRCTVEQEAKLSVGQPIILPHNRRQ